MATEPASLAADPAPEPLTEFWNVGDISLAGGLVHGLAGVSIRIPPTALSGTTAVSVTPAPPPATLPNARYTLVAEAVEIGPSGTTFNQPVEIRIPVDLPEDFPFVARNELTVWTSSQGGPWERLPTRVQGSGRHFVLTATATHLSTFIAGLTLPAGQVAGITLGVDGRVDDFSGGFGTDAAREAGVDKPGAVAVDAAGNVYFGNGGGTKNARPIVRMTPDGGFSASDPVADPDGLVVDSANRVIVGGADRLVLVDSFVAAGAGNSTLLAGFQNLNDLACYRTGNLATDVLYAAENNGDVWKITGLDGTPVKTLAFTRKSSLASKPEASVAVDPNTGNLYVMLRNQGNLYRVTPAGAETLLGNWGTVRVNRIVVGPSGAVRGSAYFRESGVGRAKIVKFDPATSQLTDVATGLEDNLNHPDGIAFDSSGKLYIGRPLAGGVMRVVTDETTQAVPGLTFLGINAAGKERYRNDKDGSVLVYLPGGSYTMGSASGVGYNNEQPAHTVTLSGFYVAEAEITWGQWRAYVTANPGAYSPSASDSPTGDNDPVYSVSWNDVQAYLTWAGLRLPTEAEWEYAARAGRTGDIYATSDGTISHDLANYSGTGGLDTFTNTSPVKTFPANAFGLFDMSGNLLEWCADWLAGDYYATSPATDPTGPTTGSYRVRRGGWWGSNAFDLRAAVRSYAPPVNRYTYLGFRPAKSAQAPLVTLPSAPSSLTATAASSTEINLSWTDNSNNESGFKIERKTGTGVFAEVHTAAANATSWSDTGLTAATSYTYRVRAYNAGGNSATYSNEASATTTQAVPGLTFLGMNAAGKERYRNDKDGSVLVKLPGGTFTMGSAPGVGNSNERPEHTVTLSGFYMAEAEITWGQWDAYRAANPGAYNPSKGFTVTDNDPVHNVSWDDIQLYLTWAGLRLPTEAEWEYAARAGRTGDVYATSDGTLSHDLANYDGIGGLDTFATCTSPVKTFPASAWGLFDMNGNVWEWCADRYGSGYYATSPATDPTGPTSGSNRVMRGGSWGNTAGNLRAATRSYGAPGGRGNHIGLRPARSAP